jgi:hypothetical protein
LRCRGTRLEDFVSKEMTGDKMRTEEKKRKSEYKPLTQTVRSGISQATGCALLGKGNKLATDGR